MQFRLSFIILVFIWLTNSIAVSAQICTNTFSSVLYRGPSFDSFTCITTSRANEITVAGRVEKDVGLFAKFSPGGTPLFSYQYYAVYQMNNTYYAATNYSEVRHTKDGGFVLAGNAIQSKWTYTGNGPNLAEIPNRVGMLIKTDAFGNVLWCQRFESSNAFRNTGFDVAATNVLETVSGDFIVYLASDYGAKYPNYGRIICFNNAGQLKWNTLLAAAYDGGIPSLTTKRSLMQTRDGSIVVGDIVYKTDRNTRPGKTLAASLHFFGMNALNGTIRWEKSYAYPLGSPATYPDVTSAAELPNGNLVFTTSFVEQTNSAKKALRIITNDKGVFQSALSYQSANNATQLLSVASDAAGNQTLLFKTAVNNIVSKINADGLPLWTQGLSNGSGLFPANCITSTANGYGVFATNFNSRNIKLLLTDTAGVLPCVNQAAQLILAPIVLEEGTQLITTPGIPDQNPFGTATMAMRADAYPFEKTVECGAQPDCCTDVIDSTGRPTINICEGSTYQLPDNSIISKSGEYYITYKTRGGCDSIVYYTVKTAKNPSALSAGADQCLKGKDSIVLQATEGFDNYYWMNAATASFSTFTIKKPGTYYVRVTNACGSRTDSVMVFNECDFPIYIPTAFSPNGDGKNEVFGVPGANKNNLVALKVFNRWGQVIFYSNDRNKGWDGKVNGVPQAAGVFVYYVQMEGLSGKKLTQTGTVLLVR